MKTQLTFFLLILCLSQIVLNNKVNPNFAHKKHKPRIIDTQESQTHLEKKISHHLSSNAYYEDDPTLDHISRNGNPYAYINHYNSQSNPNLKPYSYSPSEHNNRVSNDNDNSHELSKQIGVHNSNSNGYNLNESIIHNDTVDESIEFAGENQTKSGEAMETKTIAYSDSSIAARANTDLENNTAAELTTTANEKVLQNIIVNNTNMNFLPNIIPFTKTGYFPLADIGSRGAKTWGCHSKGDIFYWNSSGTTTPTYFSNNSLSIDCNSIEVDSSGLPWVITKSSGGKLAALRSISGGSMMWMLYSNCALDVGCDMFGSCYYIACGSLGNIFIVTKDGTSTLVTSLLNATRIDVAIGVEGNALYVVDSNKNLWKYEARLWTQENGTAVDVAISDRNDIYTVNATGVYVLERGQVSSRQIMKGNYSRISAGNKIWVVNSDQITYYSDIFIDH